MNVFDLFAKISLDSSNYEKGLENAKGKAQSFSSILKKGLTAAAKVSAVALGAAATGIVALTKKAVDNYAEYEQLIGGVETLFKQSADIVQKYADNAYKTAGLSANQYMETVTSFTASLLQGLNGDTEKAAQIADMAITDMSDNANKMGTAMSSIQAAYQGFAKQNYTMLDNLKLGYGGTKSEMERLLTDAEKLSGVKYDISNLSDVYEAIHVIQTELGITGTTAKEASATIQGSFGALKSSWENLLTGLARPNAAIGDLIDNVVGSAETAFKNLIPVVQRALEGIGNLIERIAPIIAEKLPAMIENTLPALLSASVSVVNGIVAALPTLLKVLTEQAPTIINQLVTALLDNIDKIVDAAFQLIFGLAQGIIDNLPTLLDKAGEVISKFSLALIDNLDQLIDVAIKLVFALTDGMIQNIGIFIDKAPEIIYKFSVAFIKALPKLLQAGIELVLTLVAGINSSISKLFDKGAEIVDRVKAGFSSKVEAAKKWGRDMIDNFIGGIKEKWEALKGTVSNVAGSIKSFLGFSEPEKGPLSNFHTYAPDMMKLFAKGIKDNEHLITDQLDKSFNFRPMIEASPLPVSGVSYGNDSVLIAEIRRIGRDIVSAIDNSFNDMSVDLNGREMGRFVRNGDW